MYKTKAYFCWQRTPEIHNTCSTTFKQARPKRQWYREDSDYVSGLHRLEILIIENCTKLISVEGLPSSLKYLHANGCVSLERVEFSMLLQDSDSIRELLFRNCLRLDEEARREIINHRFAKYVCLPGKQVPQEFTHKATSTYITISPGNFCTASSRYKACVRFDSIKDHTLLV
ncbi:hypothetical protein Bca52824_027660 [Brassica carinata]|uniref:Disease resistance protein n=1 Tax=Brassica carinata TaxID=52824 RepID=A0A8X8ANH1_BRACI|nr:hypothetical protein Bca52824_027660 [Brassica carinata]